MQQTLVISGLVMLVVALSELGLIRRLLWGIPLGWQLSTLYALLLVVTLALVGSLVYSQQESFLVRDVVGRLEQEAKHIAALTAPPPHTDEGQVESGSHPAQSGPSGGPPTDDTQTHLVGDLVRVSRNLVLGGRGVGCTCYLDRSIRPMEEMEGAYYLLLDVEDRPGVLAQIAGVFGENEVSIKSVWQEGTGQGAQLILITHRAREGALQKTVRELEGLEPLRKVKSVLRVEESE